MIDEFQTKQCVLEDSTLHRLAALICSEELLGSGSCPNHANDGSTISDGVSGGFIGDNDDHRLIAIDNDSGVGRGDTGLLDSLNLNMDDLSATVSSTSEGQWKVIACLLVRSCSGYQCHLQCQCNADSEINIVTLSL